MISSPLVEARLGAAAAGATVDPARVLPGVLALLAAPGFRQMSAVLRASIEAMAARLEMNLADLRDAGRMSRRAVDDSGGLTNEVNAFQVTIRADAATIAQLLQDHDTARTYLAYTGAGHQPALSWIGEHHGGLPVCGEGVGDDQLRPDDSVIVTLAISDTGEVTAVTPTYASRHGTIGEAFARAVSGWRWDPATVATVPSFWRSTLQLELRCQRRPGRFDFSGRSYRELAAILWEKGLITPAEFAYASAGGEVRAYSGAGMPDDDALLAALRGRPARNTAELDALWSRLDQAHAPAVAYAVLIDRWAQSRSQDVTAVKSFARRRA